MADLSGYQWPGATAGMAYGIEIALQSAPSVPQPLTGYSAAFVVSPAAGAPALLTLSTGAGGLLLTAAAGTLTIGIASMPLAAGLPYVASLTLTDSGGNVCELVQGPFPVALP